MTIGAVTALGLSVQVSTTTERDACEHARTAGTHTNELGGIVLWIARSEPAGWSIRLEYRRIDSQWWDT